MEDVSFLIPLLLTIGGLVIGALLKSLLKHSRIPYTVGLFAIGLALGLLNRTGVFDFWPNLTEAVDSVANIHPDLILYLFLPILIFDAASSSICTSSKRRWPMPPYWPYPDSSSVCCSPEHCW